jgi:hypothetical protein
MGGARALSLDDKIGSIVVGSSSDQHYSVRAIVARHNWSFVRQAV